MEDPNEGLKLVEAGSSSWEHDRKSVREFLGTCCRVESLNSPKSAMRRPRGLWTWPSLGFFCVLDEKKITHVLAERRVWLGNTPWTIWTWRSLPEFNVNPNPNHSKSVFSPKGQKQVQPIKIQKPSEIGSIFCGKERSPRNSKSGPRFPQLWLGPRTAPGGFHGDSTVSWFRGRSEIWIHLAHVTWWMVG
jgi:hypothetical protein